jgi:hypothetical protein
MHFRRVSLLAFPCVAVLLMAQTGRKTETPPRSSGTDPMVKIAQQNVFVTSSVLPDCYTYAVERGDPNTGPSVTLSKLAAGCKVP